MQRDASASEHAITILRKLQGLGKDFRVLSGEEKKRFLLMSDGKNVTNLGVKEAISRDITIAFSHNENFRKPACAIVLLSHKGTIVGEMTDGGKRFYNGTTATDAYVLPPVPFPELEKKFKNVCSASPGYDADRFLRTLMKVKPTDATLLAGFDLK